MLDHPAVQAAALPFAAGLVLAGLLRGSRWLALAVAAGLVVVVGLTIGFSLAAPLGSVKKLVVASLGLTALAIALDAWGLGARRATQAGLALGAGLAALWVLQRVLAQAEGAAALRLALGAFGFVAATAALALEAGRGSALQAAATSAGLGWGAGVLALIGASALLAQLGLAVGSAAAGVALVAIVGPMRSRRPVAMAPPAAGSHGATLAVPAAVAAPLVAVLASATGELRWPALLPLALAPLAARLVPAGRLARPWQVALATGLATLVPAAVAAAVAWRSALPAPGAG